MPSIAFRPTLLITLLFAALSTTGVAQNPPTPAPNPFAGPPQMTQAQQENFPPAARPSWREIKTAALSDDYAYRQVAHLTENIGPRPSGSLQAKAAVDYVAAEMRQLGLDVHLEEVKVPHWVRGAETAELVEYAGQAAGTTQKIVLTALGGSTSTPAKALTADVVVVNNFDELKRSRPRKGRRQDRPVQRTLRQAESRRWTWRSWLTAKPCVIARPGPRPQPIWAPWPLWSVQSAAPTFACRTPASAFPREFPPAPSPRKMPT